MGSDSKKDVPLDGSPVGWVSRLEVLEGPSGRRVRSEAERARIVAESLLPGAQVSEVARKHGATRWQIYDWRRRFRQRGMLAVRGIAVDIRTAGCGKRVGGVPRSGDQA